MIPEQNTVKIYQGPILAGVSLPTVFKFIDNTHVKARINHNSLATYTDLTITTQYTVSGENTDGGAIELVTGTTVADGDTLVIYLEVPFSQLTTYEPVTRFPSSLVEKQLDQLTIGLQGLNEKLTRTVTIALGNSAIEDLPLLVAGKSLRVKADLSGFELTTYDPDEQSNLAQAAADLAQATMGNVPIAPGNGGKALFQKSTEDGLEYKNVYTKTETYAKTETYTQDEVDAIVEERVGIGDIIYSAVDSKTGYLLCDGSQNISQITYANLYAVIGDDYSISNTDLCTSGAAISGGDYSTYVKGNAFDDTTSTWIATQDGASLSGNAYIGQNFGSAKTVKKLTLYQSSTLFPSSVKYQTSTNGSSWTDVLTFAPTLGTNTIVIDTPSAAQYHRFLANANNTSGWYANEIQMFEPVTSETEFGIPLIDPVNGVYAHIKY